MFGLPLVLAAATHAADVTHLRIVSGTPQRVHATVAIGGAQSWIANFKAPLVVHAGKNITKIRYTCVTPGCVIPPLSAEDGTDRPDDADAKNGHPANAFTATVKLRQASITLLLTFDHFGTYTVNARNDDDKNDPGVNFYLTAY